MSLKVRSLNNATTLFCGESDNIIVDPWILGRLYCGAWSPTEIPKDLTFLQKITHVLISHLHEDHWDADTLNLIPKHAKVFVPDKPFNSIVRSRIMEFGFQCEMIPTDVWIELSEDFDVKVIPPLNDHAQSEEMYIEDYEPSLTSLDTSFLLWHKPSDTKHLLLCDNSPYDTKKLIRALDDTALTTFWYPYNGYAQDYPLCYDNLSVSDRKDISAQMNLKRESFLLEAIRSLKPAYVLPHSSDFILNGSNSKLFVDVHDPEFMDRARYTKRITRLLASTNPDISPQFMTSSDLGVFDTSGKLDVQRDLFDVQKNTPSAEIFIPFGPDRDDIESVIVECADKMFERCRRYDIDISGLSDWVFAISCDDTKMAIDFGTQSTTDRFLVRDRKVLEVKLERNLLLQLFSRKIHWNNAQIGCYLNWHRIPNEFNLNLYRAINFFHS